MNQTNVVERSYYEPEMRNSVSVNVIPEYLFKYLTRKGIGADYLLSDLAIDERISTNELATIIYLNTFYNNFSDEFASLGLGCIRSEIQSRKQVGLDVINTKIEAALTLSCGKDVEEEVRTLLNPVYNETSPSYDFVVMGTKIWLILKSGFLETLKDPVKSLDFYRDYLRTVGKIAIFNTVAQTDVFKQYMKALMR